MTTNQTKFTISCKLIYSPIKSCFIVVLYLLLFLIYFYRSGSRTPQQPSSNSGRTKAAQQALQTGSYGSSGTGNALFRNRSHTVSGLSPARTNERGGNCNSFFRICARKKSHTFGIFSIGTTLDIL